MAFGDEVVLPVRADLTYNPQDAAQMRAFVEKEMRRPISITLGVKGRAALGIAPKKRLTESDIERAINSFSPQKRGEFYARHPRSQKVVRGLNEFRQTGVTPSDVVVMRKIAQEEERKLTAKKRQNRASDAAAAKQLRDNKRQSAAGVSLEKQRTTSIARSTRQAEAAAAKQLRDNKKQSAAAVLLEKQKTASLATKERERLAAARAKAAGEAHSAQQTASITHHINQQRLRALSGVNSHRMTGIPRLYSTHGRGGSVLRHSAYGVGLLSLAQGGHIAPGMGPGSSVSSPTVVAALLGNAVSTLGTSLTSPLHAIVSLLSGLSTVRTGISSILSGGGTVTATAAGGIGMPSPVGAGATGDLGALPLIGGVVSAMAALAGLGIAMNDLSASNYQMMRDFGGNIAALNSPNFVGTTQQQATRKYLGVASNQYEYGQSDIAQALDTLGRAGVRGTAADLTDLANNTMAFAQKAGLALPEVTALSAVLSTVSGLSPQQIGAVYENVIIGTQAMGVSITKLVDTITEFTQSSGQAALSVSGYNQLLAIGQVQPTPASQLAAGAGSFAGATGAQELGLAGFMGVSVPQFEALKKNPADMLATWGDAVRKQLGLQPGQKATPTQVMASEMMAKGLGVFQNVPPGQLFGDIQSVVNDPHAAQRRARVLQAQEAAAQKTAAKQAIKEGKTGQFTEEKMLQAQGITAAQVTTPAMTKAKNQAEALARNLMQGLANAMGQTSGAGEPKHSVRFITGAENFADFIKTIAPPLASPAGPAKDAVTHVIGNILGGIGEDTDHPENVKKQASSLWNWITNTQSPPAKPPPGVTVNTTASTASVDAHNATIHMPAAKHPSTTIGGGQAAATGSLGAVGPTHGVDAVISALKPLVTAGINPQNIGNVLGAAMAGIGTQWTSGTAASKSGPIASNIAAVKAALAGGTIAGGRDTLDRLTAIDKDINLLPREIAKAFNVVAGGAASTPGNSGAATSQPSGPGGGGVGGGTSQPLNDPGAMVTVPGYGRVTSATANALISAGNAYGVDPRILFETAYHESTLGLKETNPGGASGMFQFIPDTSKMLERDIHSPIYGRTTLNDPTNAPYDQSKYFNPYNTAQSAQAAAYYISTLLKQHGGNITAAMADYTGETAKHPTYADSFASQYPQISIVIQDKTGSGVTAKVSPQSKISRPRQGRLPPYLR